MAMAKEMFVYDLPYSVRTQLCLILDFNDKWEELGGKYMGYDYLYLQSIRKRKSPTDELLTEWGNQNHTVKELYILLFEMQHYRAMSELKDCVSEKYQRILKETEMSLSLLSCDAVGIENSNLNINSKFQQNINYKPTVGRGSSSKVQNNSNIYSNEANEEVTLDVQKKNPPEQKLQNKEKDVAGYCRQIEFAELAAATNGWHSSNILGRGGFGIVYKGTWKNTTVAIKKLENEKDHQMQSSDVASNKLSSSMREVVYLTLHRHVNVLDLFGCSFSDKFTCLVYEYMENGSLEDCLHRKSHLTLDWAQRLNIMTGSARGLQFLHSQCDQPLVHGDIKSANILLDKNFEPRLGDFGLAREGPAPKYTHVKVSRVHGTKPYLPSEYLRNRQLSVKVDTYSFGVVLFEVATGQRAYNNDRKDPYLKDHVENYKGSVCELADRKAGNNCCIAAKLIGFGKQCVDARTKNRPDMTRVLYDIETLYNNYREAASTMYHQKLPSTTLPEVPAVRVEAANLAMLSPDHVMTPYPDTFSQVGSSEFPRFSELGINSDSGNKKEEVKVKSKENQAQEESQEKSGLSEGSALSSKDVVTDGHETDPSNRVHSNFSVSLPILSQSANLPLLSDLLQ